MASAALVRWETDQAEELDRIEVAHQAVGGAGRGRRWRIQHMNDSYILLLTGHFQRFARGLHDEACLFVANQMPSHAFALVQAAFLRDRKLDRGNAHPGSLRICH
jgi:hypothetical protein